MNIFKKISLIAAVLGILSGCSGISKNLTDTYDFNVALINVTSKNTQIPVKEIQRNMDENKLVANQAQIIASELSKIRKEPVVLIKEDAFSGAYEQSLPISINVKSQFTNDVWDSQLLKMVIKGEKIKDNDNQIKLTVTYNSKQLTKIGKFRFDHSGEVIFIGEKNRPFVFFMYPVEVSPSKVSEFKYVVITVTDT